MHLLSESAPSSLSSPPELDPPSPPFADLSYDLTDIDPFTDVGVTDEPYVLQEPRNPPDPLDHPLTYRDMVLI